MMDGSLGEDAKTPLDFEDNVAVTKQVVDYAHERGVTVEGELGTLGGMEDGVGSGEICLTDPPRPRSSSSAPASTRSRSRSARATAPTSSRASPTATSSRWRSSRTSTAACRHAHRHARLLERAGRHRRARQRRRRRGRRRLRRADRAIQRGIQHGVRKVNIDTDGRLAITAFVREHCTTSPGDWDPRGVGKAAAPARSSSACSACRSSAWPATPATTSRCRSRKMAECYAVGRAFDGQVAARAARTEQR